jgi:hypothetical protein
LRAPKSEADIRTFSQLLLVAYFLEAGLILLVGPWLPFWDRNAWLHATPWLSSLADAPAVRIAVSLVGVMTMLAGLGELGSFLLGRERRAREPEADANLP